jgi:hypothetical protein
MCKLSPSIDAGNLLDAEESISSIALPSAESASTLQPDEQSEDQDDTLSKTSESVEDVEMMPRRLRRPAPEKPQPSRADNVEDLRLHYAAGGGGHHDRHLSGESASLRSQRLAMNFRSQIVLGYERDLQQPIPPPPSGRRLSIQPIYESHLGSGAAPMPLVPGTDEPAAAHISAGSKGPKQPLPPSTLNGVAAIPT